MYIYGRWGLSRRRFGIEHNKKPKRGRFGFLYFHPVLFQNDKCRRHFFDLRFRLNNPGNQFDTFPYFFYFSISIDSVTGRMNTCVLLFSSVPDRGGYESNRQHRRQRRWHKMIFQFKERMVFQNSKNTIYFCRTKFNASRISLCFTVSDIGTRFKVERIRKRPEIEIKVRLLLNFFIDAGT